MDGINFTTILDTKTQLCAGLKITKPKQAFFEFTDHEDARKMEFKKTAPIHYEVKTEVREPVKIEKKSVEFSTIFLYVWTN